MYRYIYIVKLRVNTISRRLTREMDGMAEIKGWGGYNKTNLDRISTKFLVNIDLISLPGVSVFRQLIDL